MKRLLLSALLALGLGLSAVAPAAATLTPVVTLTYASPTGGAPGAGRFIMGYITFGPNDTYTSGGFVLTPQALGLGNRIIALVAGASITINATGTATVIFNTQMQGVSSVVATGTTRIVTVTGATGNNVLTPNTPIFCMLDNAAVGGGGTGTWSVTAAVASCAQTSATTFTLTTTVAAPTSDGNFSWFIPTLAMEAIPGTPMGGVVMNFFVVGL